MYINITLKNSYIFTLLFLLNVVARNTDMCNDQKGIWWFMILLTGLSTCMFIWSTGYGTQRNTAEGRPFLISVEHFTRQFQFNLHCLISKKACLETIAHTTGNTPHLLSYHQPVRPGGENPTTGNNFTVPNIVHYISFGKEQPFVFYNYISYLSVHKYIHPCIILLWADAIPTGAFWDRTLAEVANIYYIPTFPDKEIAGKPLHSIHHASDLLRLHILRGKQV